MPAPAPGMSIPLPRGESFQIGRVLGTGGMGTVVEATHAPTGRRVALKFLHDELLSHPTIPQRFAREVELATMLTTAHVARTFGLERTPQGTPFMIMELLAGGDLNTLLRKDGRLSPGRAARIISQACEALEEAHARGIVHRDLKPENLFIVSAPDGSDWVKVLDFGISKVLDTGNAPVQPKLTRVGTTVGTPEYMAPEQLRGAGDLDGSADVYSLGCVLYEALTGRRPFTSPRYEELVRMICNTDPPALRELRSDLPADLCNVIGRAMSRDRKVRIPTARALRDALAPYISARRAEGTVVMEPPPSLPAPSPSHSSNPSQPRISPMPAPVNQPMTRALTSNETLIDEGESGSSKAWIFVVVGVLALLVIASGVVVLVFPHVLH